METGPGYRGRVVSISVPVVAPAPYWVPTSAIEADLRARYPDVRRLEVWLRMLRHTGVERRPWLAPLEETVSRRGIAARSAAAYSGARDLAVTAAASALEQGGWSPQSVDAVVTTHTTSWTVPGLDTDLVRRLGLRPDVSRLGMATVACAGGAQALIHAVRYVRACPGARVLVVAAEALSTLYHGADVEPTLQSVLYGGLFGDAAGAVLVADEAPGDVVLEVEDTYELLLPDSAGAYWGVVDQAGLHFDSGREASRRVVEEAVPYVAQWLGAAGPVAWAAVHPGGPSVIDTTLAGVGLEAETAGVHAKAALSRGNWGGVAVLEVLSRTLQDGPPAGEGVVVAYGPGFTVAGLRSRARAGEAGPPAAGAR